MPTKIIRNENSILFIFILPHTFAKIYLLIILYKKDSIKGKQIFKKVLYILLNNFFKIISKLGTFSLFITGKLTKLIKNIKNVKKLTKKLYFLFIFY